MFHAVQVFSMGRQNSANAKRNRGKDRGKLAKEQNKRHWNAAWKKSPIPRGDKLDANNHAKKKT